MSYFSLMNAASCSFFVRLTAAARSRNALSSAQRRSVPSSDGCSCQSVPIVSLIRPESSGFASRSQRRWLIPFVLLLNFPG